MKILKRGEYAPGAKVLFSDDENKTDAGPLLCEWCDSEMEVTVDDVRAIQVMNADGNVVSELYAVCGHCRKPATIPDSDLREDLALAIRIKALLPESD